jgi:hypothetical protein
MVRVQFQDQGEPTDRGPPRPREATSRVVFGSLAVSEGIKRVYGIDLGTTYSAIAYVDEHGKPVIVPNQESERITPSVVLVFGDEHRGPVHAGGLQFLGPYIVP